ncbi:MAG: DUF3299 domain-containing protein [Zetaproteobacteria bacterium]|nr:DUF3299 domain-containing protein [Zetaproteobacteria bacterium]
MHPAIKYLQWTLIPVLTAALFAYGVITHLTNSDVPQDPPASTVEEHEDPEPEKLPIINWRLLQKFDYKTGKGPQELRDLNGKKVKIPGFVVPLLDNSLELENFLLVPNMQACIHVPPPPPNLIVTVSLDQAVPLREASNPTWVIGTFHIRITKSKYGGSAYKIEGGQLEPFKYTTE